MAHVYNNMYDIIRLDYYYYCYEKNEYNRNFVIILRAANEIEEDLDSAQETAKRIYSMHSALLGRGFALASPPTISQALDGVLPFR